MFSLSDPAHTREIRIEDSAMLVVADCFLWCLMWLIDVYVLKGNYHPNRAFAIQNGIIGPIKQLRQKQGPFGNSLGSSHSKEGCIRPGWNHQQGIRSSQIQGQSNMAQVGGKSRKLSIYNPWCQWCTSVIHRAGSGSSWPHYILPRRIHSWDYRLCTTNQSPLPIRHKEGQSSPQ